MKIVFLQNYINHYQVALADQISSMCGDGFKFVESEKLPEFRIKSGFENITRPYLIRAWMGNDEYDRAMDVSVNADVLITGSELSVLPFKKMRLRDNKLTIEYSERPLKRGFLNVFSKTNLANQFYYHTSFFNKPFYKLCAGAYVANDQYAMRSFKNRCFKFGYFPAVDSCDLSGLHEKFEKSAFRILWCARFLKWKHPEMMVELAKMLKADSIDVEINMIGSGNQEEKIRSQIKDNSLDDIVHLKGNVSNAEVKDMMRSHDVFVLTSDKQEGWGVVVNEAMANGCLVVCSNAVGCAPFLLKDKENGLLFESENAHSLYSKILWAINHQVDGQIIRSNAYKTVKEDWSPKRAAKNLYQLCEDLLAGKESSINEGPCSKALPFTHR